MADVERTASRRGEVRVRRRRRWERGQALIETAIVLVFSMTLFVGVYATSVAISDSTTAGAATRAGARFGAQLGNNAYLAPGTLDPCQGIDPKNPCFVDNQIQQQVETGIIGLRFATPLDIIVYEPTLQADGSPNSAECVNGTTGNSPYHPGEHAEVSVYNTVSQTWGAWRPDASQGAYALDKRLQTHPHEGAIGVQFDFSYKSPTPMVSVSLTHREFTVNCLAPRPT